MLNDPVRVICAVLKTTVSFTPIQYQWALKLFHADTLQAQVMDSSAFECHWLH